MKRREFFKGLLAAAPMVGILGYPTLAMGSEEGVPASAGASPSIDIKVPKLPWGYKELDPEEAFKRGYLGYMVDECAGGSAWAILSMLREVIGYPYTLLPLPTVEEMIEARKHHKHIPVPMKFGCGGVEGYGTLCGALNGSCFAIEWALGPHLAKPVIRRLLRWYETTAFPTDFANRMVVEGKVPVKPKYDKPLPSVKCASVLCHVVVSKWCTVSGYASGSKQRSERCARISGSVAKKAVELMNAAIKGQLDSVFPFKLTQETTSCRVCHFKGKHYDKGEFARGFMACETCHVQDINAHVKAAPIDKAFGANLGTWLGAAAIGTAVGIGAHLVATNIGRKGGNDEENNG